MRSGVTLTPHGLQWYVPSTNLSAYMAIYSPGYSPQSFYSYSWCLDTSATYNVTPDLINLDHY
jgi:hypothetical protein